MEKLAVEYCVKRYVLSLLLNSAMAVHLVMLGGSEFQSFGPDTEKALSP